MTLRREPVDEVSIPITPCVNPACVHRGKPNHYALHNPACGEVTVDHEGEQVCTLPLGHTGPHDLAGHTVHWTQP